MSSFGVYKGPYLYIYIYTYNIEIFSQGFKKPNPGNPESEKAKALAEKPQIVVRKADLNDVASLVTAFEGCDGAFVIANFWEGMDAGKEMEQYKNAAEALKKVGTMKHVIFTTLEESNIPVNKDFKTIAQHATGDMKVPHFDGKARSEKFFEGLPTTFMVT